MQRPEFATLLFASHLEDVSASDVWFHRYPKNSVSRAVGKLPDRRLISRAADESDGRRAILAP